MTRPENRSQLMDRLGASQLNTVWSWCAVNEAEKKVYFSIWTDSVQTHNGEKCYVIQEPFWGVNDETGNKSAARNDQDAKLALVFEHGYNAYGYFIVAKDRAADPREIAETRTSFVVRLQLHRLTDRSIIAKILERIEVR